MKRQTFAVWFIIFIVWAFYRAYFHLPDWIDEFLIKPVVFVFPVIFVLVGEKNPLKEMGLWRSLPDFFLDIYLGVLIGLLFALEGMLANFIKYGQFSFAPILALKVSGGIVPLFIINIFYKISNNQFWAATSSSVLFLLLHIPILFTSLHLSGISFLVYPISILLLGITNSYVFTLRKSLTLPILIHAFWNMTVALYL